MNFLLKIAICTLLPAVKPADISITTDLEQPERNHYSTVPECYNKFVGSKGSVQNPEFPGLNFYPIFCQLEIDVGKGFVVELEFESFRLPVNKEKSCDSYIQITYPTSENEFVKRRFCPTDVVEGIHTYSQTAYIFFSSGTYGEKCVNQTCGFKISYRGVAINKPSGSNGIEIWLSSFAVVLILALIFCIFCCIRGQCGTSSVTSNVIISQNLNAPTRAELESAFEFQRNILQGPRPQIEQKYRSRTSSVNSNVASEKPFQSRCASALPPHSQENRKISIAATPRAFHANRKKIWGSDSIRRLQNVRTTLAARFSSHSSSDRSVYFDASSRSSYSQLHCEDRSPEDPFKEDKSVKIPDLNPRVIPSVVVNLID